MKTKKMISRELKLFCKSFMDNRYKTLILIASIIIFFFFAFPSIKADFASFAINALTETLGILFTVLFIDHANKRNDEKRMLEQRKWAYIDIHHSFRRVYDFWAMLYFHNYRTGDPKMDELFNITIRTRIAMAIKLDSSSPKSWYKNYWECIIEESLGQERHFEQLLVRHSNVLDPKAAAIITEILSTYFSPENHLANINREQRWTVHNNGTPPKCLFDCWPVNSSTDGFTALNNLHTWCKDERDLLVGLGTDPKELPLLEK